MNTKEVVKHIRGLIKPYIDAKISQSTFSRTLRDIEHGHAKDSTVRAFFAKFGFTQNEITWKRQNSNGN